MKIKELAENFGITEDTIKNWIKIGLLPEKEDFSEDELEQVIQSKKHTRRNKKQSNQIIVPESYIRDSDTINCLLRIIDFQKKHLFTFDEIIVTIVRKLLGERITPQIELELGIVLGTYAKNEILETFVSETNLYYDETEDFLGALYTSSLTTGLKSTQGIYYTPYKVVDRMIDLLDDAFFSIGNQILDPACGSGNFLIQVVNKMRNLGFKQQQILDAISGYDIDSKAVFLAKVNVYLLLDTVQFDDIKIYVQDFLLGSITNKYSVVIGNPPWGLKFDKEYSEMLQEKLYFSAPKQDSFSLFVEKSLGILKNNGQLLFVLPVSFLNISKHQSIREKCLKHRIIKIEVIGREFSEVVTENIIFQIEKSEKKTINNSLKYNDKNISQDNFLHNPNYSFLVPANEIEQNILLRINNFQSYYLIGSVKFGLGIVTGNNQKFLLTNSSKFNERIATGKNLNNYFVNYESIDKYIVFNPESYQQVAPVDIYRHSNRILYNFIGTRIKFAYDDTGLLTLNSANIICLYDGWDPFYVLAILNSRITQFYYNKMFHTHKLLRNHIESFKIFDFSLDLKNTISKLSKIIYSSKSLDEYENIEDLIYKGLKLSEDEIKYLKSVIQIY